MQNQTRNTSVNTDHKGFAAKTAGAMPPVGLMPDSAGVQWEHVVESLYDAALCADRRGCITYISPKTQSAFEKLGKAPYGEPFWKALDLKAESLEEALAACDGSGRCQLSRENDGRSLAMQLIALPSEAESDPDEPEHAYALLLMSQDGMQGDSSGDPLIEAMARALFKDGRHGRMLMDRQGYVVADNHALRDMFGRQESLVGELLDSLLKGNESLCLQHIFSMNGQDLQCCVDLPAAESEHRPTEVTVTKVDMGKGRFLYKLLFEDMSERKALEEGLSRKVEEVEEMQITLRNVMRSAVQDKDSYKEDLSHMIKVEVLPTLRKMSQEPSEELRSNYREVIQDQLGGLTGTVEEEPDPLFYELTPTELKVCEYIRAGHATKEISETMHLAFETVQTHRKNIRRKLGLKGRKVSLYMFLRSRGRMT